MLNRCFSGGRLHLDFKNFQIQISQRVDFVIQRNIFIKSPCLARWFRSNLIYYAFLKLEAFL